MFTKLVYKSCGLLVINYGDFIALTNLYYFAGIFQRSISRKRTPEKRRNRGERSFQVPNTNVIKQNFCLQWKYPDTIGVILGCFQCKHKSVALWEYEIVVIIKVNREVAIACFQQNILCLSRYTKKKAVWKMACQCFCSGKLFWSWTSIVPERTAAFVLNQS